MGDLLDNLQPPRQNRQTQLAAQQWAQVRENSEGKLYANRAVRLTLWPPELDGKLLDVLHEGEFIFCSMEG